MEINGEVGITSHVRAKFWKKEGSAVRCELCPRRCLIPEGGRGFCRARENVGGVLYSLVYGRPSAVAVDPIEKKPLFHFLPGTFAFSIGTTGCNMSCKQCQNWEISQGDPRESFNYELEPEDIISTIKSLSDPRIKTIAYTYTEPTIFYEYMYDTSVLARKAGLRNSCHTCGFVNEEPLLELCKVIDAANVDLKYFSEKIYAENSLGRLQPALDAIKIFHSKKVWLEITNLIIPTINDSEKMIRDMCKWIVDELGPNVPVHFTRFYPAYKLLHLPPTDVDILERAAAVAKEEGINFVYIGNLVGHKLENTFCPKCSRIIIGRRGYVITEVNIKNGKCAFCGSKIPGIWK